MTADNDNNGRFINEYRNISLKDAINSLPHIGGDVTIKIVTSPIFNAAVDRLHNPD